MRGQAPGEALRTLVIINERAGAGAMADVFRRFEHRLEDTIGLFDLAFTDEAGHGTALAREALQSGTRRILVGGGDGTINEVVNGFFDASGQPIAPGAQLGILPGGTGGDFRRSVGILDVDAALRAIAAGRTVAMDVGKVSHLDAAGAPTDHRFFANIGSFGFSGQVMESLEGSGTGLFDRYVPALKAFGGHVAHFGAAVRNLVGWSNVDVALTLDGTPLPSRRVVTVAVGNGRYFGGGMKICPDARLDSGLFDITVLGDLSRVELLAANRSIYDGSHVYHPKVSVHRGQVLEASSPSGRPVRIELDGELFGTLPARFEIVPQAIALVTP